MTRAAESFTGRVLAEVAPHLPPLTCCRRALIEGMVLAVGSRPGPGTALEELVTPRPVAVRSALAALHALGVPARVERRHAPRRLLHVLTAEGLGQLRGGDRSCCHRLRLRGAFLAAGSVSRPESAPQAELLAGDHSSASCLAAGCATLELPATVLKRRGRALVALRGSAAVAGLLSTVGAQSARLSFEQGRVVGELRAEINRRTNAETANLRRSVRAGVLQLEAISRLRAAGERWEALPPALRDAAELRARHPDDTLERLARRAGCSRPAMAGRLHRLVAVGLD